MLVHNAPYPPTGSAWSVVAPIYRAPLRLSRFEARCSVRILWISRGARDRGVEFASKNEYSRGKIQKDQCDHRRGKPCVSQRVTIPESREVTPEGGAGDEPQRERHHDSRNDLRKSPAASGQPIVNDEKRDRENKSGNGKSRNSHDQRELLQPSQISRGGCDDQRTKNDQNGKRQQCDCAAYDIKDGFESQAPPTARLADAIGPIQADTKTFNPARRKIGSENDAERQRSALGPRRDPLKIIRDRSRNFRGPGVKQNVSDFVGEALGAKETGERGHDDQERKKRHQRRQRDVAGDRPAVAFVETKKSVERDTKHA